jgi:hypothetical protein
MNVRIANLLKNVALAAMLASVPCGTLLAGAAQDSQDVVTEFHSIVPLGMEPILLEPGHQPIALFVSAESPQFEGVKRIGDAPGAALVRADQRVRHYPSQIAFRITATQRFALVPLGDKPFPIETNVALNDFLLNMHYELKIFRGLESRTLEPAAVKVIGIPADVPSNERIFRVLFNIDQVPIADRIVLEVLTPDGDRMCKFHLDLN